MNFSEYNNVFCDSKEALEWAYRNGLSKDAIIRTSSPAMLWDKNPNIKHIEKRWNINELSKFQTSIQTMSEDIFDSALNIEGVERELALAISQSAVKFQKVIYKSSCLEELDFIEPRLFIRVEGKGGPAGNNMNSPWDCLLNSNPLFTVVDYTLKNYEWKMLTTQGVSYWRRFQIAGYETIIYRLVTKIMKKIPSQFFKKELLIPNENELIIDTAASLMLQGVKVTELDISTTDEKIKQNVFAEEIFSAVSCSLRKRVKQWVTPSAIDPVMLLFMELIQKKLVLFDQLVEQWEKSFAKSSRMKRSVLMNAPGNTKGQALSYVCRKRRIPLIASQHGVTIEISKLHGEMSVGFENSVADAVLHYNPKNAEVAAKSYFSMSKSHIVGASSRYIRLKSIKKTTSQLDISIVYVSTNLYRGNLGAFVSWLTDYDRARKEQQVITKILRKLPHKVLYKTYPEDNRRYADQDPVLNDIKKSDNITLFSKKIDMRYLLSAYRVIITSGATSTLGWPVMSGTPVIFINRKEKSPLTNEAYIELSKGLFVFNDNDKDFYQNLRHFLSKPIEEIETLWREKEADRKEMIRKYFSAHNGGAGGRAAQVILKEYLI